MTVHPAFILGVAMFMFAVATFMTLLATSGGFAKSDQFRVIGELFSGKHGGAKRALAIFAMLGGLLGSCSIFGGVAASDQARAKRCDAFCKGRGNARGVIAAPRASAQAGENPGEKKGRVRGPACRCEGGSTAETELVADDVPGP